MLKVGITGGIGAGKTTVCRLFELLNVPVYYADDRAKILMTEDQALVKQIKTLLGDQAYLDDGSLNKKHISSIVFNDTAKLALLNSLVHPAVAKDSQNWFNNLEEVPFALKEAALLFEAGSYKHLDQIITVAAPLELRIERVMKRDNVARNAVLARIDKQLPQEEKIKRSDFVINNDTQDSLIQQVIQIRNILKLLS